MSSTGKIKFTMFDIQSENYQPYEGGKYDPKWDELSQNQW